MYIRKIVEVNTAASSSAGIFTITLAGQLLPVNFARYTALATPTPTPIMPMSAVLISNPVACASHCAFTSSIEPGIATLISTPRRAKFSQT
ncbi:MAG: hypothetical protein EBS27_02840 [Actinobacteria bacterium]|nr:hypothetical protein [Actinomycetota bacterium]